MQSCEHLQAAFYSCGARLSPSLQTVVAATPVATIISDPRRQDNPIIAVNQAFIDLTGYGAEEALDRNCRFLSGTGTEPWMTQRICEGARDHHPVLVEIMNYKKCGTPFRNAVLVAPIYNDGDELIYFLGTQIEITGCEQSISENRRERAVACLRQLTPRQLEVTKLVAKGLLNKQIAGVLGLGTGALVAGWPVVFLALSATAMGLANNVFARAGEVTVGVTYMTGALVRFGQGIAARIAGQTLPATRGYGLLWSALALGAAAGGGLCVIAPEVAAGAAFIMAMLLWGFAFRVERAAD